MKFTYKFYPSCLRGPSLLFNLFNFQLKSQHVLTPLPLRTHLADPADRVVLAAMGAVILAGIDREDPMPEVVDQVDHERLEPGLVLVPGRECDRLEAVLGESPVADVVEAGLRRQYE